MILQAKTKLIILHLNQYIRPFLSHLKPLTNPKCITLYREIFNIVNALTLPSQSQNLNIENLILTEVKFTF